MRILSLITNIIASIAILICCIIVLGSCSLVLIRIFPRPYNVMVIYAFWFLLYFAAGLIKNKNTLITSYKASLLQAGRLLLFAAVWNIIMVFVNYLRPDHLTSLVFLFFVLQLFAIFDLKDHYFLLFPWGWQQAQ